MLFSIFFPFRFWHGVLLTDISDVPSLTLLAFPGVFSNTVILDGRDLYHTGTHVLPCLCPCAVMYTKSWKLLDKSRPLSYHFVTFILLRCDYTSIVTTEQRKTKLFQRLLLSPFTLGLFYCHSNV